MKLIADPALMQKRAKQWLVAERSVGFVPTMGSLHDGHLSLVKRSRIENEVTVVSIFVNPAQFGPNEDYLRYPKNLEKDLELLRPLSVDLVFHPEPNDMFPPHFQTRVTVEKLSAPLYGSVRPHFFGGVALVVVKLFHLIQPTRAYFGEKDYQQFLVVRQMVKDLNLDLEIVLCPTIREPDGLALSSRNTYLSETERKKASLIYAALKSGKELIRNGEKSPAAVKKLVEEKLRKIPGSVVDCVAVADPTTLKSLEKIDRDIFLFVAVRIGETRLIDGLIVKNR